MYVLLNFIKALTELILRQISNNNLGMYWLKPTFIIECMQLLTNTLL